MLTMTAPSRSSQIRAVLPETYDAEPHPRAVEMANTMLDIAALGNGVVYRDLLRAGFTNAEIIEHHRDAERIAGTMSSRQINPEPDRMADMIEKARAPFPDKMPLPAGMRETQTLFQHWGRYCAARGALLLDPWPGQRERCYELLLDYLHKLPLLPAARKKILRAVSATLQQVTQ